LTSSSRFSAAIDPDVSMDERQGRVLAGALAHLARLEADPQQDFAPVGERGRAAVGDDRERVVERGSIALVEGVHPFLDADAGRIGSEAVVDVPLGDRVRGRVDVQPERGHAVLDRVDVRVDPGSWYVTPSYGVGAGCSG
jgi:hypothetical protein